MWNTNRTRRVAITTGMALALLVALVLPLGYFAVSYQYLSGAIDTEAEISAGLVSGIISTNPDLWRYEQMRLEEQLGRRLRAGQAQCSRILDMGRNLVAECIVPLSPPLITRSHELRDSGVPVGTIELSRSLRPLLLRTSLVALLGLGIGGTLFILLWQVPFRGVILAERRRQEFIDTIMENSTSAVMVLDPAGLIVTANARSAVISGWRVDELVGGPFTRLFKPGDESSVNRRLDEVSTGSTAMAKFKTMLLRADGKELSVFCGAVPLLLEGRIVNLLISIDDVSERVKARQELRRFAEELSRQVVERQRAEESLAREKELLSVTLCGIGDGVISTDCAGALLLLNRRAEELTGWPAEEALGRNLAEVFRVKDAGSGAFLHDLVPVTLAAPHGLALPRNNLLACRGGQEVAIELNATTVTNAAGTIIGVVVVFRDITGRLALEDEYLKRQKLESVGVLAAGIAHDFNNLLTAIMGNISMARQLAADRERCEERLLAAEKASYRAGDLTRHFMSFTKGGVPIRKLSSVALLIQDAVDLALTGSNVKCDIRRQSGLWPVEINESQITEVLHNLIINACQAMPDGGLLDIHCGNTVLGEGQPVPLKPGNYVTISVADQGGGIPSELLPKIFDPYFTTKETGNGLGLAVVYSVLQKHDGHISVESVCGEGTTFHLYLPASEKTVPAPVPVGELLRKGQGRVLLMDDEEMVLEAGSEMLRLLGFQVESAVDGAEMLEKYRTAMERGDRIDAVILDLTIPGGMGGAEAVTHLLQLDPQARAIVSSGFDHNPVMADYAAHGFRGVVSKPYTIVTLERAIHNVVAP